ncbi:DUF4432 family protein [Cyanobacterium stanieri LEGE 03274]|uniref:DUF4432 family protein n=1 Tax=Cyanobacterium stanieri LEGE 03274 TaxID=1828756 RepID=A0ABR9V3A3_9CHRO|nr:DUF4432 family protein [Cyanobacterium stanieri]MBE9222365.1 DUF4432 family protein [Cyanobacterium stanieri LEGE 03274]
MYTHGRKQDCRITLDYTYKGMRVAFLENNLMRIGILIDKGGDIFEITYKPKDIDFLWQSPIAMRPPFTSTNALAEGAYHDYYYGGWQEILPSAGWSSEPYKGTYQGLHGEVSLLPVSAQIITDTPELVTLKTEVTLYRSPLKLEKHLSLKKDTATLFIKEKLTNTSPHDFEIMWGHHPVVGEPFLDTSCTVQAPAKKIEVMAYHPNGLWTTDKEFDFPHAQNRRTGQMQDVTKILGKESKSVDVLFFKELQEGWYGINNHNLNLGLGMAWDHNLFKYLWMWQVYQGHDDYPWYGRTYNLGLEPFTSYPPAGIDTAIKNGSSLKMKPHQIIETNLVTTAYEATHIKKITLDGVVHL